MDEYEKYLFDLNGYLILEDVLSSEEVAACNEAIDSNVDTSGRKQDLSYFTGMLVWPEPACSLFREIMAFPKVISCLLELHGDAFRLDHIYGILVPRGAGGLIHSGGHLRHQPACYYGFHNGRICSGVTVVTWLLTDCRPGDGGFGWIPCSHKSNYTLAKDVASHEKDLGVIKQVEAKAGSVVIFPHALTHGTLPWVPDHDLRSIRCKYSPGPMTHHPPDSSKHPTVVADTRNYLPHDIEKVMDDLTPLQRALLEPPYHPNRPNIKEHFERQSANGQREIP